MLHHCPTAKTKLEPELETIKRNLKPSSHPLLGRRQANLCFHFAGSEENLPDIAKPRDASMGRKQNSFLF